MENKPFLSISNQRNANLDSSAYTSQNMQAALQCLAGMYVISVNDSLYTGLEFYFHRKKFNGQVGIITYLPIKNLPSGINLLKIEKSSRIDPIGLQQDISFQQRYNIPFVKE